MVRTSKTFYCLRCQQRFLVDYEPQEVVERSCPACGSNSVRPESASAAERSKQSGKPEEVSQGRPK